MSNPTPTDKPKQPNYPECPDCGLPQYPWESHCPTPKPAEGELTPWHDKLNHIMDGRILATPDEIEALFNARFEAALDFKITGNGFLSDEVAKVAEQALDNARRRWYGSKQ